MLIHISYKGVFFSIHTITLNREKSSPNNEFYMWFNNFKSNLQNKKYFLLYKNVHLKSYKDICEFILGFSLCVSVYFLQGP